MSTNSESDERSSSSSNNMLFNFDFDSQPLPTRIPLQVFIGSMKQFQNRPKHLEHSYYIQNNEVNINADFINSKEFDAFNLHFTGEFQQFNFKNLISIKQQVKQITLNKCTVALNCQIVRAEKIDFQDCFVSECNIFEVVVQFCSATIAGGNWQLYEYKKYNHRPV
ncbi:Hypothetical_protein [Hexamita inflata]|uniref:Hypothetical_protein n=1 Tax=Hexamita inflata TaxID=28002 RepID=A0AA86RFC5_9EUKA|nr:Hypothetical protein HINF_LOCUS61318 [Hexamita inflata]